jgi:hypothetical protein
MGGEKVGGEEPGSQRKMRAVHHGASDQRGLMPTRGCRPRSVVIDDDARHSQTHGLASSRDALRSGKQGEIILIAAL